jgi:hypothetical protein
VFEVISVQLGKITTICKDKKYGILMCIRFASYSTLLSVVIRPPFNEVDILLYIKTKMKKPSRLM